MKINCFLVAGILSRFMLHHLHISNNKHKRNSYQHQAHTDTSSAQRTKFFSEHKVKKNNQLRTDAALLLIGERKIQSTIHYDDKVALFTQIFFKMSERMRVYSNGIKKRK